MIPNLARAALNSFVYLVRGRPILAPKSIRNYRLAKCRACRHFIKTSAQCGLCLCDVETKGALAAESCPILKWVSLTGGDESTTSES
jgi:hypothetical protein